MSQKLFSLYKPQSSEEKVSEFSDANGFSIIKKYKDPKLSKYEMMFKVYLTGEGKVEGSINAVQYKDDEDNFFKGHFIVDKKDLEIPLNNFMFNDDDFTFNDGFFYTKNGIKLSVNKLVENIEYNHVSRKVGVYQKISKTFYEALLKIIFWLGDASYSYEKSLRIRLNDNSYKDSFFSKDSKEDPLFKYFYINKNILFISALLFLPIVLISCEYYNMEVTRLPVVVAGIAVLFLLEKVSLFIKRLLKDTEDENSLIKKLIWKSLGQGWRLIIRHK